MQAIQSLTTNILYNRFNCSMQVDNSPMLSNELLDLFSRTFKSFKKIRGFLIPYWMISSHRDLCINSILNKKKDIHSLNLLLNEQELFLQNYNTYNNCEKKLITVKIAILNTAKEYLQKLIDITETLSKVQQEEILDPEVEDLPFKLLKAMHVYNSILCISIFQFEFLETIIKIKANKNDQFELLGLSETLEAFSNLQKILSKISIPYFRYVDIYQGPTSVISTILKSEPHLKELKDWHEGAIESTSYSNSVSKKALLTPLAMSIQKLTTNLKGLIKAAKNLEEDMEKGEWGPHPLQANTVEKDIKTILKAQERLHQVVGFEHIKPNTIRPQSF